MGGAFQPGFDDLPRVIPVFPLTGVLLLPGGKLPLNIFEPRYLAMTRDALATTQRLIGMVQPAEPTPDDNRGPTPAVIAGAAPAIYRTGCAGRITSFDESEDGRYLLTLTGVIRFETQEELAPDNGHRRVVADYTNYRGDLLDADGDADGATIDRERLLQATHAYFIHNEISANWEAVEDTPNERLITSLAMTCAFNASERQALLEAPDLTERARVVVALMEMAVAGSGAGDGHTSH